MAYNQTRVSSVLSVTARNVFNPSYLRAIAGETLNWKFKRDCGTLKLVSLQSLLDRPHTVNVSLAPHVWGEAPTADLTAVCTLVAVHQPQTLFEFGTFTGHTTLNMAANAPSTSRIFTLDLPPNTRAVVEGLHWEKEIDDDIIGSCWRDTSFAPRITQLYADSLI